MAFENIKAQIYLLLEQMINQPEDSHEIQESLREMLNELKATGMPLPQDLVELEETLQSEFEKKTKSI